MSVTPIAGSASVVTTGGTAVNAGQANINGGYITNPASASDQGLDSPEDLFINPVTTATTQGNGTTFRIPPGGTWIMIPGQTTNTSVNAASSGHKFSIVVY